MEKIFEQLEDPDVISIDLRNLNREDELERSILASKLKELSSRIKTLTVGKLYKGEIMNLFVVGTVKIENASLTEELTAELGAALSFNESTKTLDLSSSIPEHGISFLSVGLATNSVLKKLILDKNTISEHEALALSESIGSNAETALGLISARFCNLTEKGAMNLAGNLESVIVSLDLSQNYLGGQSLGNFFKSYLENTKVLKALFLNHTQIDGKTIIAIVKSAGNLETLEIGFNPIEDVAVAGVASNAVAALLRSDEQKLKHLDISKVFSSPRDLSRIETALKDNHVLLTLGLASSNLTPQNLEILEELSKSSLHQLNFVNLNNNPLLDPEKILEIQENFNAFKVPGVACSICGELLVVKDPTSSESFHCDSH